MDILELGAKLFAGAQGNGGGGLDVGNLQSALGALIGEGQELDLAGLVSAMQSGGLGALVESWLGDGANEAISPQQIGNALGDNQIAEFASRLNIDVESARSGLASALPQMVDKASSGGSLLESVGGAEGLIGMVGKLLK